MIEFWYFSIWAHTLYTLLQFFHGFIVNEIGSKY